MKITEDEIQDFLSIGGKYDYIEALGVICDLINGSAKDAKTMLAELKQGILDSREDFE